MVNSLSCNDKGLCSWSRPQCHSNTVVQYNLTVVQNNTVVLETTTTNTYWTYCPLYLEQFGEFELTVAPFCSTLGIIIGESVSTTISGSKGNKGIHSISTDGQHVLNCKQCKLAQLCEGFFFVRSIVTVKLHYTRISC